MLVTDALRAACHDVIKGASEVPLPHWNESVFRFFFVRNLLVAAPRVTCFTEWNRIDVLLREEKKASLIELKFYQSQPLFDLSGHQLHKKGGAGSKNFGEFLLNIDKLRSCGSASWLAKHSLESVRAFLALVYTDPVPESGPRTYGAWYDTLPHIEGIKRVEKIISNAPVGQNELLSCKLIEVALKPNNSFKPSKPAAAQLRR